MKILMLTTNSSLMDGINRHILNVSVALNSYPNIEMAVCTINPAGELNAALNNNGIKTFALGYSNGHALGIYKEFGDVIRQFCPDIIHLHVMAFMERVYLSIHNSKHKLVQTIHGISIRHKKNLTLRDYLEKYLQKLFPITIDARCYISEGVKEYYHNITSSVKISQVCYNPIKFPDVVHESQHKLHKIIGISTNDIIVGTVCRIAMVKNPIAFTTVMCNVLTSISNAHAVIIGTGDDSLMKLCRSIIAEHHLEKRFHWLGYRSDAPELVCDFDCFIMTSISEGLPTSILECFVSKTPVAILEGMGGINDILRLNTSERPIVVTASKENLIDFSMKIVHLLTNRKEADTIRENAYIVSKETFGMESVVPKLIYAYKSVLNV